MKVVFRVDASLEIGSGHVMRCLTLADELSSKGASCCFICRTYDGNLIDYIQNKGYCVHALEGRAHAPVMSRGLDCRDNIPEPQHLDWLGASQSQDATDCIPILKAVQPDWLIVDHYGIDARWEWLAAPYHKNLMVIDDLADRPHIADVLLDQNLGRQAEDYDGLVPRFCRRLIGPRYALLRPEFREAREASLARRKTNKAIRHILISMGGMDKDDATSRILDALAKIALPADVKLSVVMGRHAPALERVCLAAAGMPWPTRVLVDVEDMASLMSEADLAIGAGGSTTWERCCLGLPTIVVPLAENQEPVALEMANDNMVIVVENVSKLPTYLPQAIARLYGPGTPITTMINSSSSIVDGAGCCRVAKHLEIET